ncbi:MAG: hypothetical protein ACI4XM_01900 [Candidatus Coprovivens sp.]
METNNNYNEYKIKSLENDLKTNKTLATLAGATAALGTTVAIGNYVIGNDLIAIQNISTTVAMAGYIIGYIIKSRLNNQEISRLESIGDKEDSTKDKIDEIKHRIKQTKNSLAMSTNAAIGMGISSLTSMILVDNGYYNAVATMVLTGTVSILNLILSYQNILRLINNKEELSILENDKNFKEEQSSILNKVKEKLKTLHK